MPILNFKPQFVPYILDGTKRHTIRAARKRPIKPGDKLYLYTGLRQKGAKLLDVVTCSYVNEILIRPVYGGYPRVAVAGIELDRWEASHLAWQDGFRTEDSSARNPGYGCFVLMAEFWRDRLPFVGQIIHWTPPNPLLSQTFERHLSRVYEG